MSPQKQVQIDAFLADLKAKMMTLETGPDAKTIHDIRSEAQGHYDVLSRQPNLDNPHWRQIHDMVCAVLSRTASTMPGGGRSRANQ